MSRDAFGPTLRRLRIQRGIPIEAIADATRVSADLWHGLERNDLSRWPTGLFARAYVRQYADAIGIDADATVDEFCRWFPEGDRRAERILQGQAEIVDHHLKWKDDLIGLVVETDRRAEVIASPQEELPQFAQSQRGRIVAALADVAAVVSAGLVAAALLPVARMSAVAVCGLMYHGVSLALVGCTPSVWVLDTYIVSRYPEAGRRRFLRLTRGSVRVKV